MLSRCQTCLVLLIASCGSAQPEQPETVEDTVDPSPVTGSPTTIDPVAPADTPVIDSPHLGSWGCRGPISHVAMSYEVSLELHASGRFDLSYSDVSPEGGRVVRMEGVWQARASDDAPAVYANAEAGSETTWSGDMHREQHRRDPDGPVFVSQRRRAGVSTAERRWTVLGDEGETPLLQLGPDLSTRIGRAVTRGAQTTWPRCDPGRFNR